jgi:hypothetical protein
MKWTSTFVIALAPVFVTTACDRESRAAPKTASKLQTGDPPMSPDANSAPAPDANASTRKPAQPQGDSLPPAEALQGQPEITDEPLLTDADAAIPTQEEANREAEQAITEENADQELEKLEKELEGGG